MKKVLAVFISVFILVGCTNQTPVSQAPVYNITVTDNSQYVVGDNNKTDSKPTTKAEQTAEPDVSASARASGNSFYLFLLGFVLGAVSVIAGYLIYLRYIKKRI